MKRIMHALAIILIVLPLLTGCGGGSGESSASTVVGVAAAGAPLVGTVTLKDSSGTAKELSTSLASDGSFSFNVTELIAPFLLQATGTAGGNNHTFYTLAATGGNCNINPLTHLAVTMANGGQDPVGVFVAPAPAKVAAISTALPAAVASIHDKLAPLFNQVGASPVNVMTDKMAANHQGVDLLFDLVAITVSNGSVSMVNKADGGIVLPPTSTAGGVLGGNPNTGSMTPLFAVTGSLTLINEPGKPVSGAYVTALNTIPGGAISSIVQTDAQGNFQLLLPNGSYHLELCNFNPFIPKQGYSPLFGGICAIRLIEVSSSNVSGLTFGLPASPPPTPDICPPGYKCID